MIVFALGLSVTAVAVSSWSAFRLARLVGKLRADLFKIINGEGDS